MLSSGSTMQSCLGLKILHILTPRGFGLRGRILKKDIRAAFNYRDCYYTRNGDPVSSVRNDEMKKPRKESSS